MLWVVSLFIVAYSSLLYSLTALQESLLEFLPMHFRNRLRVTVFCCIFPLLLSFYLYLPNGQIIDEAIDEVCIRILDLFVLLVATTAILFIYSIGTVIEDMHFVHGKPPSSYFITAWTICPMFLGVS